jgi:hypothetical protein
MLLRPSPGRHEPGSELQINEALAAVHTAGGERRCGRSRAGATRAVDADEPIAPPQCSMRLSVEVTPDVPNPGDGGFLSSLLGNNAGYQLFLLRVVDDTHVVAQLQGPGPAERCQAVVDSMSNDGRVLSIQAT